MNEIDELEGSLDYWLDVAAIDVDENKEREINVALNNQALMGSYDQEALAALFRGRPDLDLKAMAMSAAELAILVPDTLKTFVKPATDAAAIQKIKAKKKEKRAEYKENNDSGYYVVVVFGTRALCDEFLGRHGLPLDQQYIDGELFAEKV